MSEDLWQKLGARDLEPEKSKHRSVGLVRSPTSCLASLLSAALTRQMQSLIYERLAVMNASSLDGGQERTNL